MEAVMAIAIGLMFAAALYMMLRRSIIKLVMGLIILSNAANLVIFAVSGMTRADPAFVDEATKAVSATVADPFAPSTRAISSCKSGNGRLPLVSH